MVQARVYPSAFGRFVRGDIDWDAHTIKLALFNGYVPDLTDEAWDDIGASEVSGAGYTAGGQELMSKTTQTVNSDTLSPWQASSFYSVTDLVRPTTPNGHGYQCIVAGTSSASEPIWPTEPRNTTTEGATLKWSEIGVAVLTLNSSPVEWTITEPDPGITATHAILYRDSGTAFTSWLIGYIDFETSEQAYDNGTFTVTPDPSGWIFGYSGY